MGFEYTPPKDFLEQLNKLQSQEVLDEVLKAGGEAMLPFVKQAINQIVKDGTGDLERSVKVSNVRESKQGDKYILVSPTGRDRRGTSNAAKLGYIEFGVKWPKWPERIRVKRPFIKQTEKKAEPSVLAAMKKKMEEFT
ncbi:MAG TPA: HK97 gp10 family phage protein [bacterium]|nr:HK97 gp10 family phage protein [bacterium]